MELQQAAVAVTVRASMAEREQMGGMGGDCASVENGAGTDGSDSDCAGSAAATTPTSRTEREQMAPAATVRVSWAAVSGSRSDCAGVED